MNFNDYKKTIRKYKLIIDENEKYRHLLKIVHGVWKRLSQTIENGENSFEMSLNLNNPFLDRFKINELVKLLHEFSFNVSHRPADENDKNILGNRTNIYILKFKTEENISWADMTDEMFP